MRIRTAHFPSALGIRGAAFLQFGSRYLTIAVQLVITAVLSRLISPDEYGTVAIVTVFTTLFNMFSDMGISTAIVQFRTLDERDYGALFGFSLLLGASLAGLFCVAAIPISWVYGRPELVRLCYVASISLFFSTINMVPSGLMLKERRFVEIGMRLVVTTLLSGIVAIEMALHGAGSFSLVLQTVTNSFMLFLWNYLARPVRHLSFSFGEQLRTIFSYSAFQFGFSTINYFSRNLDNLLIGKILGAGSLGYYDKAYKLTTYPLTAFSSVISSVVQPFMAEHQDNKSRIFEAWFKVVTLLSIVGAPVGAMLFCAAEEIVLVMFGEQWAESAPLLRALAVCVYFQMLNNPTGSFFQSINHTDLMFKSGLVNTALTVGGLSLGLVSGSLCVTAWMVSAAFCLQIVPTTYMLVCRGFGENPLVLLRLLPDVAIAVVAVGTCFVTSEVMPEAVLSRLAVKICMGAAIFLIGYAITGRLQELRKVALNR